MQLRIQSSEKKKLMEETSQVREIEMRFLDKESSRQYSQVKEEIMKTILKKQSHPSMPRSRNSQKEFSRVNSSPRNYKTTIPHNIEKQQQIDKDKVKVKDNDVKQDKQQKVEIQSQQKVIEEHVKKIPYKFSYKSTAIELVVAYSVTFAILYFIKLANFPYFQLILIIAFTVAVQPIRSSNLLMLICLGIVIGNYFLNLSFFTYPSIVICYYAVMVFNQDHKKKQLFVFVLVFTMVFGFILLPVISNSLYGQGKKDTYIWIFPILMLVLRSVLSYCYWVIDHTALIFLQLPLFLTGLYYGAILSFDIQTIEFWYLLVTFSLQIVNDRTHFLLNVLVSILSNCSKKSTDEEMIVKNKTRKYSILPAHSNGYACLHSFHIFILVYIYAGLGLYTAPFTSSLPISIYITPGYKPVVVWLLSSVYEIMSILLSKTKKNVMFFGFISNKWWRSVLRGFVLSLGMWVFYLGLGLGVQTFFYTGLN